jgi:aspartyl-tRNA(Asn)/glutamyl-tRNA(Gln) amidotransferase subunit A
MTNSSVCDRSIPELADSITRGEVTAETVATAYLERIAKRDGGLGAFLTVQRDETLETARAIDRKRSRGDTLGPLAGVPIAIKDALCTRNVPTTAGSRILLRSNETDAGPPNPYLGFRPPYDATVVERLRAADALLVGKTNMDEFAMGSSNENSAFFPARNPWDTSRTPGGSSGGSAVAVAAGMSLGALGSDTGGSIRQPASLTGTVGIKPTYGRVSRYGLLAFASSLDQVGPFATDVRGAARILRVIAGHDTHDQTSLTAAVEDYEAACGRDVRGLRIGVPEEYFGEGLAPEVERRVRDALKALESLGCSMHPVHLPHTRYAVATYYVIATAEASSNLARYDGLRFGARAHDAKNLDSLYARTRGGNFGREVARRIVLGTFVLSTGYYDAYYLRAQRARTLVRRDFEEAFRDVDVIATPVSPTVAFPIGERVNDPLAMYLADVYTLPASLAGVPAISVPCEPTAPSAGVPALPVGLQLIAPPLEEGRLCALASAWERLSPARGLRPEGLE